MTVTVPFLDLRVPDEERAALLARLDAVLRHGRLVLGPEVAEIEGLIARFLGRKHAIGVNSGSDAVWLALRAVGIGPGDEVITTPLSFIASANAIRLTGATPVFGDIGDDLNLDPACLEALITPRTKAILPVHWTGRVCRMDQIGDIARRHGLMVVEDCSQAFDATYRGRRSGSFGIVAACSMNSMKVYGSLGEAGVVSTDDDALADRLGLLRYNGMRSREICEEIATNSRLDTIQAAFLIERLERLPAQMARRRAIAAHYNEALADLVEVPLPDPDSLHGYYTYTIQTDARDALMAHMTADGIEVRVQHSPLMPEQAPYAAEGAVAHFPNAQRLIKRVLCLPVHDKLSDAQRDIVVDSVRQFFGKA